MSAIQELHVTEPTSANSTRQTLERLIDNLRVAADRINLGRGWSPDPALLTQAAMMLEAMRAVGIRQEEEILKLKCVIADQATDQFDAARSAIAKATGAKR